MCDPLVSGHGAQASVKTIDSEASTSIAGVVGRYAP